MFLVAKIFFCFTGSSFLRSIWRSAASPRKHFRPSAAGLWSCLYPIPFTRDSWVRCNSIGLLVQEAGLRTVVVSFFKSSPSTWDFRIRRWSTRSLDFSPCPHRLDPRLCYPVLFFSSLNMKLYNIRASRAIEICKGRGVRIAFVHYEQSRVAKDAEYASELLFYIASPSV